LKKLRRRLERKNITE